MFPAAHGTEFFQSDRDLFLRIGDRHGTDSASLERLADSQAATGAPEGPDQSAEVLRALPEDREEVSQRIEGARCDFGGLRLVV